MVNQPPNSLLAYPELPAEQCIIALVNLHSSTQPQDEVQSTLLLDVVVRQGATILKLLPCKDETLLVRRNTFLVLQNNPIA